MWRCISVNITSTFDAWLLEKDALVKKVQKEMCEHRFTHTLAVAKESLVLANAFDLSPSDSKRLFVAALLHDYTKAYSTEKQIALAEEYNVALSEDDLAAPAVLHSRTAAAVVIHTFPHDTDAEIAEAVRRTENTVLENRARNAFLNLSLFFFNLSLRFIFSLPPYIQVL